MYNCDFCNIPMESLENEWCYKTKPFTTLMFGEIVLGFVDDGEWLACDDCSLFIEKKDKQGLEDRAVKLTMESFKGVSENQVRPAIHQLHTGFWNHKKEDEKSCQKN